MNIAKMLRELAQNILNQVRDQLINVITHCIENVSTTNVTHVVTEAEIALNAIILEFVPGALRPEAEGFLQAFESGVTPGVSENVKAALAIALVRIEALLGVAPSAEVTQAADTAPERPKVDMSSVTQPGH